MSSAKSSGSKGRRSSILKTPKPRQPFLDLDFNPSSSENSPNTAKLKRRVSFAEKKHVKEFCDLKEQGTIWDNTYEESEHSTIRCHQITDRDASSLQYESNEKSNVEVSPDYNPEETETNNEIPSEHFAVQFSAQSAMLHSDARIIRESQTEITCDEEVDFTECVGNRFVAPEHLDNSLSKSCDESNLDLTDVIGGVEMTVNVRRMKHIENSEERMPVHFSADDRESIFQKLGNQKHRIESKIVDEDLDLRREFQLQQHPKSIQDATLKSGKNLCFEDLPMTSTTVTQLPNACVNTNSDEINWAFDDENNLLRNKSMEITSVVQYSTSSSIYNVNSDGKNTLHDKTKVFENSPMDMTGMDMISRFTLCSNQNLNQSQTSNIPEGQTIELNDSSMQLTTAISHSKILLGSSLKSDETDLTLQDRTKVYNSPMEMTEAISRFTSSSNNEVNLHKTSSTVNDPIKIFEDLSLQSTPLKSNVEHSSDNALNADKTSSKQHDKTRVYKNSPMEITEAISRFTPYSNNEVNLHTTSSAVNNPKEIFEDPSLQFTPLIPNFERSSDTGLNTDKTSSKQHDKTRVYNNSPMEITEAISRFTQSNEGNSDKTKIFEDSQIQTASLIPHSALHSDILPNADNTNFRLQDKTRVYNDSPMEITEAISRFTSSSNNEINLNKTSSIVNDRTKIFEDSPKQCTSLVPLPELHLGNALSADTTSSRQHDKTRMYNNSPMEITEAISRFTPSSINEGNSNKNKIFEDSQKQTVSLIPHSAFHSDILPNADNANSRLQDKTRVYNNSPMEITEAISRFTPSSMNEENSNKTKIFEDSQKQTVSLIPHSAIYSDIVPNADTVNSILQDKTRVYNNSPIEITEAISRFTPSLINEANSNRTSCLVNDRTKIFEDLQKHTASLVAHSAIHSDILPNADNTSSRLQDKTRVFNNVPMEMTEVIPCITPSSINEANSYTASLAVNDTSKIFEDSHVQSALLMPHAKLATDAVLSADETNSRIQDRIGVHNNLQMEITEAIPCSASSANNEVNLTITSNTKTSCDINDGIKIFEDSPKQSTSRIPESRLNADIEDIENVCPNFTTNITPTKSTRNAGLVVDNTTNAKQYKTKVFKKSLSDFTTSTPCSKLVTNTNLNTECTTAKTALTSTNINPSTAQVDYAEGLSTFQTMNIPRNKCTVSKEIEHNVTSTILQEYEATNKTQCFDVSSIDFTGIVAETLPNSEQCYSQMLSHEDEVSNCSNVNAVVTSTQHRKRNYREMEAQENPCSISISNPIETRTGDHYSGMRESSVVFTNQSHTDGNMNPNEEGIFTNAMKPRDTNNSSSSINTTTKSDQTDRGRSEQNLKDGEVHDTHVEQTHVHYDMNNESNKNRNRDEHHELLDSEMNESHVVECIPSTVAITELHPTEAMGRGENMSRTEIGMTHLEQSSSHEEIEIEIIGTRNPVEPNDEATRRLDKPDVDDGQISGSIIIAHKNDSTNLVAIAANSKEKTISSDNVVNSTAINSYGMRLSKECESEISLFECHKRHRTSIESLSIIQFEENVDPGSRFNCPKGVETDTCIGDTESRTPSESETLDDTSSFKNLEECERERRKSDLDEGDSFAILERNIKKHEQSDDCVWAIRCLNRNMLAVDFISKSLVIVIFLGSHEGDSDISTIQRIRIISLLSDEAEELIKSVHYLLMDKVNPEKLILQYYTTEHILSLLTVISQEVKLVVDFMYEFRRLDDLCLIKLFSNRISFFAYTGKAQVILKVTINLKPFDEINPRDVSVDCMTGSIRIEDIKQLITSVKKDHKFIRNYLNDIRDYIKLVVEK